VQRFVALLHQTGEGDRWAAKAAARQARELYSGDLLAGMPYPWLHERLDDGTSLQERYCQDYSAVTGELARLCVEDQEYEQAAELYKELLRAEPLLEDVLRNLYRCYAALGDRASLVQQHRHLEQALRDMFDGNPALAQPQPETVAAYRAALARVSGQPAEQPDLRASA
jgi:two-component SAPR family response regulator